MPLHASVQSQVAKTELRILQKVCREINSPRSLTVYLLATNFEFDQLLNLSIDHEDYDCPSAFADDYLVTEMLKKTCSQPTGINREEKAFSKWALAEKQCLDTNEILDLYRDRLFIPKSRSTDRQIARAIEICHDMFGRLTKNTLNQVFDSCDFGPGVTTSVKGVVTRGRKYSNKTLTVTQRLLGFGIFCLPHLWKETVTGFEVVDHNVLTFVPKNAKVDRAITIENDLNIYVQKGIGRVLRRKLLNFGVDLDTQWKVNRTMASKAFASGYGTIDLSSASDTISLNLVRDFIPPDWFELLCMTRPDKTLYKDKLFTLEKFSGMGCGFTFELETIIFYSILQACKEYHRSPHPITAFGDDLICGLDIYHDVVDCLNFLGFSVNSDKSFGYTTFHESCGADFFRGVPVRPFYLRFNKYEHGINQALFLYCNRLRRYASHRFGGVACDSRFLPAWLDCFSRIPKTSRVFVPSWDFEYNGIVGNLDEAAPTIWYERSNGYSGIKFRGYVVDTVKTQRFTFGAYLGSLVKQTDFCKGIEPIRNRVKGIVKQEFYTLSWIDLGPWLAPTLPV